MEELKQIEKKVDRLDESIEVLTKAMLKHADNRQPSQAIYALKSEIEHLKEKTEKGFSEIIKRQDYTNGKVVKNTEYRLKTEGITAILKWLGAGNVVVAIVYLGSLIVK